MDFGDIQGEQLQEMTGIGLLSSLRTSSFKEFVDCSCRKDGNIGKSAAKQDEA